MIDWIVEVWNQLMGVFPEHVAENEVNGLLPQMALVSLLIGLLAAAVLVMLLALLNKYRNGKWTVSGKSLTTLFCVTWLLGFMVYEIALYTGGPWSFIANAPMAMIHAFEMFILESDVAAVHGAFHENLPFMALFSMVHFLAAAVSMIFVIKHFGFNIVAGFRMFFEAYFKRPCKETYVFWGMNEPSYLLAKSINLSLKHPSDYRIIIVRPGNDREQTSVRNGMDRLFNFLSLKNKDLEKLQELGCLTTSTFTDLSKLNVPALDNGRPVDVFGKQLGLHQLARILSRKTTRAIHLFFLGEDQSANIQCIANLKLDKTIQAFASTGHNTAPYKVQFYCHARYNHVHRVIEDVQIQENIDVKVIDSSRISIEQLKQDVTLHPVNFVDIEKDATVSSPFNALVVGFGEVGVDAVHFLYEFGAFVKHGTTSSGHVERSPFHCDVVDARMPIIAGPFLANAPAITTELVLKDGTKVSRREESTASVSPLVSLHELDINGVEFYKKLEAWIEKLNFIVIATDDDDQNMALAVRVFRLAVRYRDSLKHFRILVCVRSDHDGHIRRTAEHYNRLWAAELNTSLADGRRHQRTVERDAVFDAPITVFGLNDTIYTYDYIISDRLVLEAKSFKERYDASIAALKQQSGEKPQATQSWDTEYQDLMQLIGDYKGFSPTYTGMMRLRRIQSQNRQNCFHLFTKQRLARRALGNDLYGVLASGNLFRKDNEIHYEWRNGAKPIDAVIDVLDVLARTEHLRWCASHEILGYRDQGDEDFKDEVKFLHGCIKPWEQLSPEKQSYDYNIVDVSLGIINQ